MTASKSNRDPLSLNYLDGRDDKLTANEIRQLGSGIYLARFIMTRAGSSKDLERRYSVAKLVIQIHTISEVQNGVADIHYSYTGLRSPETPEASVLHIHEDGVIPPESYVIPDQIHGRDLTSVEGYLRPYERTLRDLLNLAPSGSISIPT